LKICGAVWCGFAQKTLAHVWRNSLAAYRAIKEGDLASSGWTIENSPAWLQRATVFGVLPVAAGMRAHQLDNAAHASR
jgi:hypothetical protein